MANGHGGKREGAGRPRTRQVYVPDPDKLSPLDYMLQVLRDEGAPHSDRMDAAKAAAPYAHARLQQTSLDVEGDVNVELISYLGNNDTDTADNA